MCLAHPKHTDCKGYLSHYSAVAEIWNENQVKL